MRAVLEGVACGLRDRLDLVRDLGARPAVGRVSGGGARSDLWLRIVASVLELPLQRVAVEEGAAYGAALLGGVAGGVFADAEEAVAACVRPRDASTRSRSGSSRYGELRERYRALYPALRPGRRLSILCKAWRPHLGNRPCGGRYGDIVQAIGNTPLVELRRMSPKPGVRIWAKLESHNPTGSIKDRVARALIEDAEERGRDPARPDDPRADLGQHRDLARDDLLAQGLRTEGRDARQRHARAHPAPEDVRRRDRLLRGLDQGSNGAVEMALEMAGADASYYMPYQYGNPANPRAHYDGTAPEILGELDARSPRSWPGSAPAARSWAPGGA